MFSVWMVRGVCFFGRLLKRLQGSTCEKSEFTSAGIPGFSFFLTIFLVWLTGGFKVFWPFLKVLPMTPRFPLIPFRACVVLKHSCEEKRQWPDLPHLRRIKECAVF